ncbi:heparan-alpha-glucosaminide N-acetyltransferase-like isoform X2 [Pectinophora gossypiella]|uniref:heparan-alpha-glucosaminide N-acetyltransferase-like isoform X2 n=1 Tax=Pectinophora gossypiella TaxID=13191 RepID=UPI00214E8FEA|nr:heparan-alpha-glucosaminide N-acetyltransferase-like isoform X2 [Pectinophora gossypiella]
MAGWYDYPALEPYKLDRHLPLNHAWVVANTSISDVDIYSRREDCYECQYELHKSLKSNKPASWMVDSSSQVTWLVMRSKQGRPTSDMTKKSWLCEMRPTFHEGGIYRLDVGDCEIKPEIPVPWTSLSLLASILILLVTCTIYTFARFMYNRKQQREKASHGKALEASNENDEQNPALNVFKGILMSMIIFVTTGGGGYAFLTAPKSGITLAEGLLYMYVWSIGVNIPTFMDKAFRENTKCHIFRDIFVRALILVFMGTTIDSIVAYQMFSISLWCPLQKIGIAYLIVATAYVLTVQRFEMKSKKIICKAIKNLISLLWIWIIAGFLIAIFIILTSTFVSFNCLSLQYKRPSFWTPPPPETQNCNNHVSEYANKILVGQSKKTVDVHRFIAFTGGAMGILSTILIMMIGLKSGVVYLQHQAHSDRLKLWGLWATLFGLGGTCFAVVTYPLEFNLWPLSSIQLIGVAAMCIFSLIYVITEVWRFNSYILSSLGISSLVVLCGHVLFSGSIPFRWGIVLDNHVMFLLQNYWIILLWIVIGIALRRRNVHFEI